MSWCVGGDIDFQRAFSAYCFNFWRPGRCLCKIATLTPPVPTPNQRTNRTTISRRETSALTNPPTYPWVAYQLPLELLSVLDHFEPPRAENGRHNQSHFTVRYTQRLRIARAESHSDNWNENVQKGSSRGTPPLLRIASHTEMEATEQEEKKLCSNWYAK